MSHANAQGLSRTTRHTMKAGKLRGKQQGFTLLELMIASIIFVIMAVMAYGGLDNVISNNQAAKQSLQRLQQIQQTVSILNRDFRQIVNRPIRDEFGIRQDFLVAGNDIDTVVEFTRGGRVNPGALIRSSLLRVAYQLDDETLVRLQWPHLDRTQEMEAKKTVLIDNMEKFTIRFLNDNNEWQDQWPPLNAITGEATSYPLAIEVLIQLKDWGEIRRLYKIDLFSTPQTAT